MTLSVPYPADVRAKGWRFEIDYEKVEQSDTWSLAAEIPMAQHALLMMWMVAWTQVPCGSMPNDESLIRAKCRIPAKTWPNLRPVLMRGWWLAEDGRLYHDTIVQRVEAMLVKREKDAKRTADRRARNAAPPPTPPGDTGVSRVTPTGPSGEFDTKHQAPSTFSVPNGTGGAAADGKRGKTPAERRKSELWAGMKTFLVDSGESKDLKAAGAVITKTIQRFDEATALAGIEATLHKRPAGAIAYLEGACQQALGLRQNKQEVLETGNLAAAERFASEPDHATH